MRISTNQVQQQGIDAVIEQQAKLAKTQLQVASGKRIINPADDPSGATRLLGLAQTLGLTRQYQANADAAENRLTLEESALGGVTDLLQRVRELALQANNGTLDRVARAGIADEVNERLEELLSLANTKDSDGEHLFAGYQGNTKPFAQTAAGTFTYAGDEGQRFLQIGPSRQVAVGDSGTDVFRAILNGNGTFVTSYNGSNQGSGIVDPGSVTDTTAYVRDTYTIAMADRTSVAGGALSFTDVNNNDALQYQLSINGTVVDTLNEGDSRTLAQLATNIQAQSGATGVTAYVDGGVLYLANTTASGNPISVTESLLNATEATDTATGYFGSSLSGASASATVTLDAPASGYVVLDSSSNIETSGTYQDGAAISFNGIETNISGAPSNGDTFTLAPSSNQDIFTTVKNLASALAVSVTGSASMAQVNNDINRAVIDLDRALDNVVGVQSRVGSRLNAIDGQRGLNDELMFQTERMRSSLEDLDFAEAASRLNRELIALQAAQQAYVRVQNLSLFNFMT